MEPRRAFVPCPPPQARLLVVACVADGDKEQVQAFADQHHTGTDLPRSLLLPLPSAELVSDSVNSPSSVLPF